MKKNYWLILGAMLSTSLLAQQATSPTPSAPIQTPAAAPAATLAPATATTNVPPAKAVKKKAAKKAEKAPRKKAAAKKKEPLPELKTVPLVPGPAVVVASNVNVRGQAKLKSEVVAELTKGDSVTVIEEIVRNNSGPEEPSAWAKIALPPKAHVWVNTAFVSPHQHGPAEEAQPAQRSGRELQRHRTVEARGRGQAPSPPRATGRRLSRRPRRMRLWRRST